MVYGNIFFILHIFFLNFWIKIRSYNKWNYNNNVQDIKSWSYWKILYAQTRLYLQKWEQKIIWNIKRNEPSTLNPIIKAVLINKLKRTWHLEDLAIPARLIGKIKENEMIDKHLDFSRELKNIWNMKVTLTPVVVGTLWTISKRPRKKNGESVIQRMTLDRPNQNTLQYAWIFRNLFETWGDLLSLWLQGKAIT